MSRTERREYLVGVVAAVTLALVLVLTALANRHTIGPEEDRFELTADFGQADGVYVGSPARIGGIDVGIVSQMHLNNQNRAVLTFQFFEKVPLPEDTAVVIETDGIFGTKYVELYPGGTEDLLESGDRISYSQDSVILEELIALIVDRARAAAADSGDQETNASNSEFEKVD